MKVIIRPLLHPEFTLECDPKTTVFQLKEKVEHVLFNYPPCHQDFIYKSRHLPGRHQLGECGINDGSSIILIVRHPSLIPNSKEMEYFYSLFPDEESGRGEMLDELVHWLEEPGHEIDTTETIATIDRLSEMIQMFKNHPDRKQLTFTADEVCDQLEERILEESQMLAISSAELKERRAECFAEMEAIRQMLDERKKAVKLIEEKLGKLKDKEKRAEQSAKQLKSVQNEIEKLLLLLQQESVEHILSPPSVLSNSACQVLDVDVDQKEELELFTNVCL